MVTAATTARAASFGNPDEPPQGAINAKNRESVTDPGPQNPALATQFPSAQSPPSTDVGDLPQFWASFNNAPKRIQNGGWARQVTQADFAISETISGINMRLAAGGIRELHWHLAAEWAYMTYGKCRVTVLDDKGRAYVSDVNEGDLWYFPAGFPHSLQGLAPDGCEFIICFDDGKASEFNTTLVTDWLVTHLPKFSPRILEFRLRHSRKFPSTISGSSKASCLVICPGMRRPLESLLVCRHIRSPSRSDHPSP